MRNSIVFDGSAGAGEEPYQQWLRAHPTGLVLNTRRLIDPKYMVLHSATCTTITHPTRSAANDPFTGRGYIKICSDSKQSLVTWIASHGGSNFTKLCGRCAP